MTPILIAHRGMPKLYPEESVAAYRSSLAAGASHIECDCQLLKDGALGVMHDATLDRTCTTTGNVADQTSASWNGLRINSPSILGAGWDTQPIPFLDDLLREFGGEDVVFLPEAKSIGSGSAIVERLQHFGISPSKVIVQSEIAGELTAAQLAGYDTMLVLGTYAGTPTPAALAASGYAWIGVGSSTAPAQMTALQGFGLKVIPYTVNTRKRLGDVAACCDGVFSDEALYLSGAKRLTNDPFISQKWYHGHLSGNANGANGGRGDFYAPIQWGFDMHLSNTFASALMGWANPIGGVETCSAVTIDVTVQFMSAFSADRWASLAVCTTDVAFAVDSPTNSVNGYHFLFHKNGKISIYKLTNAGAPLLAALTTGITAIPDGGSASYRITVSGSNLTLDRTDIAYTVTTSDTDYRGSYLHAGCKGVFAKFSGITITTP